MPKVYIALPILNEFENLPKFLECIDSQDYADVKIVICVNQPNAWWEDADTLNQCENNQQSLDLLTKVNSENLHIIDRSSKGKAWDSKKYGVGWARKTCLDYCVSVADDEDLLLCVDADTYYPNAYISSIVENFKKHPKAVGLSIPYYHPLTNDESLNRNILRYEIYMRYYALNLWRIDNPYHFTALGSAIACPVSAYKRINGMTPHKSGEDFYFIQKLKKFGQVLNWNSEKAFPSSRYSDRVFFGTGPALIKGESGDWSSYPIYNYRLFDEVKESFSMIPKLFNEDLNFPMKAFLDAQFGTHLWLEPLRKNSKVLKQFERLCVEKIDALRILQYLKSEQKNSIESDEANLMLFLGEFYKNEVKELKLDHFSFKNSSIEELNRVRDFLQSKEEEYQYDEWK